MQEAVQASPDVAAEFNQQEITNEHFLLSLLDQAEASPVLCSKKWACRRSR
jgi:ATP-dependent Clp protease ATP-binding subunit ClpA